MKKLFITSVLAAMVAFGTTIVAQEKPAEYLGLPGDNLNLYAVMKLFQESKTLEEFERNLNSEDSKINNLDLNGDGMIDYITVNDYPEGNVHTIVLRAVLGKNESQDVAVFTVQKFDNGSVQIQLIGDEDLYGKNYIIEPIYDQSGETPNPGYMGNDRNINVTVINTSPVEVAGWPLVRFMFFPNYSIWRSAWYWGYYPRWWRPWHPFYWDYYYGYHYHWYNDYYAHYHRWNVYRCPVYSNYYVSHVRVFSPEVNVRIRDGRYRDTYSHPEERKRGEALYERTNPARSDRRQDIRGTSNETRVERQVPQQGNQGVNSRERRVQQREINNGARENSGRDINTNRTQEANPQRNNNNRQENAGRSNSRMEQVQRNNSSNDRAVRNVERSGRSETVRVSRPSVQRSSSAEKANRSMRSGSSGKSEGRSKGSKSEKESRRK